MIVPFVPPEVRSGSRLEKKFVLDFGLTFFVMIPPQSERQPAAGGGSFQLPNDKGRQAPVGTVTGYATTPTSQNGPIATFPHENGFRAIFGIVPSIFGHFDF